MRKGMSLSFETIVVITISMIVLIFLIIWFSGAGGKAFGSIAEVVSGTDVDTENITNATRNVMTGTYD